MEDCNPVSTPLDINQNLDLQDEENEKTSLDMSRVPYQEAVGALLYLSQATRPDIAHTMSVLSKYNQLPRSIHWKAIKRVFRYLKGTIDYRLRLCKGADTMTGYSDADMANNIIDRRSVTGYAFVMQGAAISWASRRQPTVALSTAEAEYMALSSACQEATWLRLLMRDLDPEMLNEPTIIHSDNKGAIALAETSHYRPRTKHIDVRHHFLREKIEEKIIKISYILTEKMIADILTKALPREEVIFCREKN
uniref:POLX_1 protein n=1 Tax=Fopius arisanus TaxID=64838 RepID=A0A0C9S056_9HYME